MKSKKFGKLAKPNKLVPAYIETTRVVLPNDLNFYIKHNIPPHVALWPGSEDKPVLGQLWKNINDSINELRTNQTTSTTFPPGFSLGSIIPDDSDISPESE